MEGVSSDSSSNGAMVRWDAEKIATGGIWVLIAYTAVKNVFAAASKPFWYDELCTVAVAHQPNLAALWSALTRAKDSSPPLYSVTEHFCALLVSNEQIAYRLPSIVGLGCVLWCLFVFVRKQEGQVCAFLCALLPIFTPLYKRYAIEARSYSLVVACIAIALVCYQHAPRRSSIVFLGLALASAEAFHYYAFLSFAPFAIAEFAWTAKAKRIRWGVWLAFSAGFLPLLASWPLLMELKRFYGPDFWGKPSFAVVEDAYGGFLRASGLRVVPGLGFIFAGVLSVAAILTGLFCEPPNRAMEKTRGFYEPLLAVGFLGVPFVAFVVTKIGHGSLTGRYLLSTVLGVAIATSCVLRPLRRRGLVLFVLIVFLLVGISRQEMLFWKGEHEHPNPADSIGGLLSSAGHPDLPVVVSDGKAYVELAYYAPADLAKRLVGIVDPPNAVAYARSDSIDRQVLALTCCFTRLHVHEFRSFATEHPSFLLYSDGTDFDWWPARLRKDGYLLEPVASDENENVYWVKRNRDLHWDPASSQQGSQ